MMDFVSIFGVGVLLLIGFIIDVISTKLSILIELQRDTNQHLSDIKMDIDKAVYNG